MGRRILKIAVTVCIILVIGLLVSAGLFFGQTYDGGDVENYCAEHSEIKASDFSPRGLTKLEGYMFWIANKEEEPYQQEVFIFREEKLWGFISMQRYALVKHIAGSENQIVSTVQFEANSKFSNRETTAMLFFSSNPSAISRCRIFFQENGHMGELYGGIATEEEFIVGILDLGVNEYLHRVYEGAIFYDVNGNVIEIEGDIPYSDNKEEDVRYTR